MSSSIPVARRAHKAFTLVELLVVIGIIALLVGILLPALNSARKQAETVKCAAALREIGNDFLLYAHDNRGFAPPAKTVSNYRLSFYSIPPVDNTAQQYWPNFLARYVTRGKAGTVSGSPDEAAAFQATILWGCPAFAKYFTGAIGGYNRVQNGYGMNGFPEYTATYPTQANPPNVLGDAGFSPTLDGLAVFTPSTNNNWYTVAGANDTPKGTGKWYKLSQYTKPAERVLVADGQFWLLEVQAAPMNGQIPPQKVFDVNLTWYTPSGNGQTLYDFYRHGKYPGIEVAGSNGHYAATGGKIAYNVLFCDGHVSTLNSREDGYKAGRMRFPG